MTRSPWHFWNACPDTAQYICSQCGLPKNCSFRPKIFGNTLEKGKILIPHYLDVCFLFIVITCLPGFSCILHGIYVMWRADHIAFCFCRFGRKNEPLFQVILKIHVLYVRAACLNDFDVKSRNNHNDDCGHRWQSYLNPLYTFVGWNRGSSGRLAFWFCLLDGISICILSKRKKRETKKGSGSFAAQSVPLPSWSSLTLRLLQNVEGHPTSPQPQHCCYSRP